jgi:hypothetical protein
MVLLKRPLILVLLLIIVLYYKVSISVLGDFNYRHYFSFKNPKEAYKHNALISESVKFDLLGLSHDAEKYFRKNIQIWMSKSYYDEVFGFLFTIQKEDTSRYRIYISSNCKYDSTKIIYKIDEIWLEGDTVNLGTLSYCTMDILNDNKKLNLNLIKRINKEPKILGKLILQIQSQKSHNFKLKSNLKINNSEE